MNDRLPSLLSDLGRLPPPVDDREQSARHEIADLLQRLPRPFDRNADSRHLTASAIVVGDRGVLLHHHRRIGLWLQPGGHLEDDEHGHSAAIRETVEETGLQAVHPASGPLLFHVDVHPAPPDHVHLDLRYLLYADGEPAPPPGESQLVRWFDWEEALALADPGLAGALRAARRLSETVVPGRPSGSN